MKYKVGDIVVVSSPAGDVIPNIHVELLERVVVKPSHGNRMDWPGYSGWKARLVFQEEADFLRTTWSIPYQNVEDSHTFVYDSSIVKKPRNPKPSTPVKTKKNSRRKRRIVRPAKGKK
tara:strand:- start:1119 stop:1472 length:354 start_codon:yes stop_codon:yes gene_type:complete